MSLRQRLEPVPATIQDFDLAAERRYWEALELMVAGHDVLGVYVIGYVAEMMLKYAYFRVRGAQLTDPEEPARLVAIRQARHRTSLPPPESGHSLRFWFALLGAERQLLNRPFDTAMHAAFDQRVQRLYLNWWVELRYRPDAAQSGEMQAAYDDVTWLRAHAPELWR